MKPQVNHKWRKQNPRAHKSYGEKRERDEKIRDREEVECDFSWYTDEEIDDLLDELGYSEK